MKTPLLLLVAMSFSSVASAYGTNLAWNDCDPAGTAFQTFACNTNSGSHTAVLSFRAPPGIDQFVAAEAEVFFFTNSAAIPDWWRVRNQGTTQINQCRNGALSANVVFSNSSCLDPYLGNGAGGIASYLVGYNGDPKLARLLIVHAVPAGSEQALAEEGHYYAANVVIGHAKTVGTGSCAGCSETMGILVNYINVVQPNGAPGGNVRLTEPDVRNFVGWQGTCQIVCTRGGQGCFVQCTTAARTSTWGSVKAIYR